jgi:hypothetical protein
MLLPTLSSGSAMQVRSADARTTGISPSFCTPCVLGKRVCGLPFSPSLESCGDSPGVCSPCIPFLNKKVCVGLDGPKLVNC